MDLTERTVKRNTLYSGKILTLRVDDAETPDGKPCKREIVQHSGGAAVLCVVGGAVALVKQFRYAYGEEIYEIPAGKLGEGEDPMLAAKRELNEETGLVAGMLKHLFTLYPSPGYTSEKIYIYEALNISRGAQKLDEGEFLNVEYIPIEEAIEMVRDGRIKDAKSVTALLYLSNQKE